MQHKGLIYIPTYMCCLQPGTVAQWVRLISRLGSRTYPAQTSRHTPGVSLSKTLGTSWLEQLSTSTAGTHIQSNGHDNVYLSLHMMLLSLQSGYFFLSYDKSNLNCDEKSHLKLLWMRLLQIDAVFQADDSVKWQLENNVCWTTLSCVGRMFHRRDTVVRAVEV